MTLVSQKNSPITQMLLNGFEMFSLEFDFAQQATEYALKSTDQLDFELGEVW